MVRYCIRLVPSRYLRVLRGEKIRYTMMDLGARGVMGRDEGKTATGEFRSNMAAGCKQDVHAAIMEGKMACSRKNCRENVQKCLK